MFAQIDYVVPPTVSGLDGSFMVESLPLASCQLWRRPVAGDNSTKRSKAFAINADGWFYASWGATAWTVSNVTVIVYVTCAAASPDPRTAQSADKSVVWPPAATPTPVPTLVPTAVPSAF
jgi:hypothetical protein